MKANPVASLNSLLSRPSIPRPQPQHQEPRKPLRTSLTTPYQETWSTNELNDQPFVSLPPQIESLPDWSSDFTSFQKPSSAFKNRTGPNMPSKATIHHPSDYPLLEQRMNDISRPVYYHHPISSLHANEDMQSYENHGMISPDAEFVLNRAFFELEVEEEKRSGKDEASIWRDEFLSSLEDDAAQSEDTPNEPVDDDSVQKSARTVLDALDNNNISDKLKEKLNRCKFIGLMKQLESGDVVIRENDIVVP